jgi:hypothetical protein
MLNLAMLLEDSAREVPMTATGKVLKSVMRS